LREPWYVAHQAGCATKMRIFRTKRIAIKAAAEILRDQVADVEVGPMVDTRDGVLRGEELRRIAGLTARS
jgi:hypothetical protein